MKKLLMTAAVAAVALSLAFAGFIAVSFPRVG